MDDSLNNERITHQNLDLKEWVVVKTMGGGYIGRVHGNGIIFSKVASNRDDAVKTFKQKIFEVMSENGVLELDPCFDFMSPLRPVHAPNGQMGLQRDPIVVPFDFTTENTPVYVKPTGVMFCGDLQGKDKETYKSFVLQALDQVTKARAQAMGIELVTAGGPLRA